MGPFLFGGKTALSLSKAPPLPGPLLHSEWRRGCPKGGRGGDHWRNDRFSSGAHGSVVFLPSARPDFVADGREDVLHFGKQALVEGLVDALHALLDLLRAGGADERGGDVAVRGGELQ